MPRKKAHHGPPENVRPRAAGATTRNEWGLTPIQERFAQEVASGKTYAAAYRAVANIQPHTKPGHIITRGSMMAKVPATRARIAMLAKQVEERFEVKTADVLRETCRVAFVDPANLIDPETNKFRLLHELDEDTRRAVASFEIDDLGRIKYKFWDKVSALDKLMRHKGLFAADNAPPVTVSITKIELVALERPATPPAVEVVEMDGEADAGRSS